MCIYGRTIFIEGSNFTNNRARTGGVLYAEGSTIHISESRFLNNHANDSGGCGHITNSTLNVSASLFEGNSAEEWGGAFTVQSSTVLINSISYPKSNDYTEPCDDSSVVEFVGNTAELGGALFIVEDSIANIHCSTFQLNRAESRQRGSECRGGAIVARTNCIIDLSNSTFHENKAKNKGGALFTQYAVIRGSGCLSLKMNSGGTGAVYITNSTASFSGNLIFANNTNSFYAHSSEVAFGGESIFEGGVSESEDEGGAITAIRSTVMILNWFTLQHNRGDLKGGGIHLTESFLTIQGQALLQNNTAKKGGAVNAYKSNIKFSGDTVIEGNVATSNGGNGGGLFLVRSDAEYHSHFLSFYNNVASNRGGAIYFDQVSTLYIVKKNVECAKDVWYCVSNPSEWLLLTFHGNSAKQGGAMFVNDYLATSCDSKPYDTDNVCNECFIQTVTDYMSCSGWEPQFKNINFTNNTASDNGSLLYGGLLDRCAVDAFAEQRQLLGDNETMYPLDYFKGMCHNDFSESDLASDPLRICFCSDEDHVNCNAKTPNIVQPLKRGVPFTVSVTVVDQMNKSVNSSVNAYLESKSSRLSEGQSKQDTDGRCTDLEFTIFTANESETLTLYPDGPCADNSISKREIVLSINPKCPVGFALSNSELECTCNPIIEDLEIECSMENETIKRQGSFWISAWNDTSQNGSDSDDTITSNIILHEYCPYDYCYPPTEKITIDLKSENGFDDQCAFNRIGILCGCCGKGYSLVLGSSECRKCTHHWLLLIILFGLVGICLVSLMMVCNLTLASGTINGLLFYANIMIANRSIFFPFQEQTVLTVFVSWLGLNLGIATCFYDGMNAFSKMWVQISFEVYLIFLVVVIILLGRNVRISSFFHKYNLHPIHTLATLIMLSYEKLSRKLFSLIAYTELKYPDGNSSRRWLLDPCIEHKGERLIPLAIVAGIVVLTGAIFNFVLLFNKVVMARCRSVYFNTFMVAFFAPFKPKHQYWVGLLLLTRNLSYLMCEFLNADGNPDYNLLFIFSLVIGILMIKFVYVSMPSSLTSIKAGLLQQKKFTTPCDLTDRDDGYKPDRSAKEECIKENGIVYKNPFLELLETSFLVNLLILTYFTLYLRDKNQTGQNILFNVSSSIVLITFAGILIYHTIVYTPISKLFRKRQQGSADERLLLHNNGENYGTTRYPTQSEI